MVVKKIEVSMKKTYNQSKSTIEYLNLKYYILYGMMYEFLLRLYKPFEVKFLERIGGNEFHISLLNSLPGLIMVFTTLPAILLLRNMDAKKMTGSMVLFTRLFVLFYAFIPFLNPKYQPIAFIILTALLSAPASIYTNSFQSLTGELFPPDERANALGQKSKYAVIVNMLVIFITGEMLANLPVNENQRIILYQLFFITAFLLTFVEIWILSKLKPQQETQNNNEPIKIVLTEILTNREYLLFVICSLIFHFGWQMGWPLFSIYTIKNLGADEGWLAILSLSSLVTMLIGHTYWPRLIRKYGNPTIIAVCSVGMALTPILYILSDNLYTLTFMAGLTGIFTSGTLTVLLSSILEVIPTKNRMIYMGVYTTFTNITLAIAPILGHYFLSSKSIQFALLMSALFRLLGGFAFIARNQFIKNKLGHA
jgi:MFS family permease